MKQEYVINKTKEINDLISQARVGQDLDKATLANTKAVELLEEIKAFASNHVVFEDLEADYNFEKAMKETLKQRLANLDKVETADLNILYFMYSKNKEALASYENSLILVIKQLEEMKLATMQVMEQIKSTPLTKKQ